MAFAQSCLNSEQSQTVRSGSFENLRSSQDSGRGWEKQQNCSDLEALSSKHINLKKTLTDIENKNIFLFV